VISERTMTLLLNAGEICPLIADTMGSCSA
jgi:hypothetical protein